MTIPDKIRIGGVDYLVQTIENLRDGARILYGHIDYDNSRISLSGTDGIEHQRKCIILWHEILHGIANHAELNFEKADEETIITVLARGIYQVLMDNKTLTEVEG